MGQIDVGHKKYRYMGTTFACLPEKVQEYVSRIDAKNAVIVLPDGVTEVEV